MKNTKCYKCAGNAMWVDFKWNVNPNMPTTRAAVDEMQHKYFPSPKPMPHIITIAVPSLTYNPMEHMGELQRVSPNEPGDALLLAIADDVRAGAGKQRLEEWQKVILTVQFHFELLATDDEKFWRSQQLRENVLIDFTGVYPTAFQRIVTVVSYKAKKEAIGGKVSSKALAESWHNNVELSSKAEQLTDAAVENAVTVWNRMLCQTEVRAVIMAADEELGHNGPFDSINKLHVIVYKGKTKENIAWIVFTIWDLIKSGERVPTEFGTRVLSGSGGKGGLCDFYMRKKATMEHMQAALADELGISTVARVALTKHLGSHAGYRALVPYGKESHQVDMSWLATWKDSERKFFDLVESVVYLGAYDMVLLQCVKDL